MRNEDLVNQDCVPCKGGVEPLQGEGLDEYVRSLSEGWQVVEGHHLEKIFKLKDFKQALELTNKIGRIAEEQGHHPVITLTWGKVTVKIWTHKIDGLHVNDFILAVKIDKINL